MRQVLTEKRHRRIGDPWAPQPGEGLPLDPRDVDVVVAKELRRSHTSNDSRKGPDQS
jgi:hypothetical protein